MNMADVKKNLEGMMTFAQAAEELEKHPRTLDYHILKGNITCTKIGHLRYFDPADVAALKADLAGRKEE